MKKLSWILTIFLIGSYNNSALRDPDLWWHLVVGKWILFNKTVPFTDHWNMFAAGKPWAAYSWSNEIVYALTDLLFGLKGLATLQLVLSIGFTFTLFYVFGKIAKDNFFGGLIGTFCVCICIYHFALRPQTLVWIFFAFLILYLEEIRNSGFSYKNGIKIMFIMCLWANTHITTIIGLTAVLFWLYPNLNIKLLNYSNCRPLIFTLCFAFLGTLITPYLGYEWVIFFLKSGHPLSHSFINEFGPASILDYSTGITILVYTLLCIFMFYGYKVIPSSIIIYTLLMLLGGLAIIKFLPLAGILGGVLLSILWRHFKEGSISCGNLEIAIEKLRELCYSFIGQGSAFLILILIFINSQTAIRQTVDSEIVPLKAFDFILDNKLPLPVLNSFGNGGYVMYRLSYENGETAQKVPIDGRTNVNPDGIATIEREAFYGFERWNKYLEAVSPNTVLWRNGSPLIPLLIESKEWCRVFRNGKSSDGFSVLIKKSEFNSRQSLFSDNCVKG